MRSDLEERDGLPALITVVAEIVAAYVSNNAIPFAELPALIASVYGSMAALDRGRAGSAPETPIDRPGTAEIRKSMGRDGIVSFIDGRSYKTLKRHLAAHGLTPAAYCERYGLPGDYPMVAPSYSERRSSLAKAIGLGVPGAQAHLRDARRRA